MEFTILELIRGKDLQSIKDTLYNNHINFHYDESRILVYANRKNFPSGLIIDRNEYKIVCCPPPKVTTSFNRKEVENNWASYKIYPVVDGTMISLYYYNDKWIIATQKGINMNEVVSNWGNITFQQAFNDANEISKINLDALDKATTYTYCLSHKLLHFGAETALTPISTWNNIYTYSEPTLSFDNFDNLWSLMKSSIELEYPKYGVVLRSPTDNILVESFLQNVIKMVKYSSKWPEYKEFFSNENDYLFVKAVLTKNTKYTLLWPQNTDLLNASKKYIYLVAKSIMYGKESGYGSGAARDYFCTRVPLKDSIHSIHDYIQREEFIVEWGRFLKASNLLPK